MDQVGGARGLRVWQSRIHGALSVRLPQANHGGIRSALPPELKALGAEPSEVELVDSPESEESGKVGVGLVCQGGRVCKMRHS